ncbi:adhesion G-protein coupled receptor G6 [Lingula anatina]|uniref:Adhesion G-protein coupled receptor G6 n=1 Tax=Lingula anatina TaxID=7574 RepID=A0A1S3I3P9_LINAN|nr:adhesion G-protein coupled receptor G6 [Lingula anatina]|eukprot:XP_013391984.1 adhesion G-protein coupled receptor G6 [Lingula anatina]
MAPLLVLLFIGAAVAETADYQCILDANRRRIFYIRSRHSNYLTASWSKIYIKDAENTRSCYDDSANQDGYLELMVEVTSRNPCGISESGPIVVFAVHHPYIRKAEDTVFTIDCGYQEYATNTTLDVGLQPWNLSTGHPIDLKPEVVMDTIAGTKNRETLPDAKALPSILELGTPVHLRVRIGKKGFGGFTGMRIKSCIVQISRVEISPRLAILSDYCGTDIPEIWPSGQGFVSNRNGTFAMSPVFNVFALRGGATSVYFLCTVTFCSEAFDQYCDFSVYPGHCIEKRQRREAPESEEYDGPTTSVNLTIYVINPSQISTGECASEVTSGVKGRYQWPLTQVNSTIKSVVVHLPCQFHIDENANATRTCVISEENTVFWQEPELSNCVTKLTLTLHGLQTEGITLENAREVAVTLSEVTSGEGELFDSIDVDLTTDVLAQVVTLTSDDPIVAREVVQTVGHLMDVDPGALLESEERTLGVTRILEVIEEFAANMKLDGNNLTLVTPNLALSVADVVVDDADFDGIGLDSLDKTIMENGGLEVKILKNAEVPFHSNVDVAIRIPRSLFVRENVSKMATASQRVHFVVYNRETFFEVLAAHGNSSEQKEDYSSSSSSYVALNGRIISGSLVGKKVQNLKEPIRLYFRHLNEHQVINNSQCVYWDFDSRGGLGGWSNYGCKVALDILGNSTECHCNHLTNFALLVDVYSSAVKIDKINREILSIITYVGCAISSVALLLTIVTHVVFRKLLKDIPAKILINLCVALLGLNLMFVSGTQELSNVIVCKLVAAFLHYFLLSTMSWMLVEAFYMYLALVKVFDVYFRKMILKFAVFGWGFPLFVVVLTTAINVDHYGYYTGYDATFCWLTPVPMYITVIAPIGLTIVLNFVSFILVFRQIRRHAKQRKITSVKTSSVASQVKGTCSMVVLLGLTWGFAFLTVSAKFMVFHYLFAIFNSLQGLFLFIFHCFMKSAARAAWWQWLPSCFAGAKNKGASGSSSARALRTHEKTKKTTMGYISTEKM